MEDRTQIILVVKRGQLSPWYLAKSDDILMNSSALQQPIIVAKSAKTFKIFYVQFARYVSNNDNSKTVPLFLNGDSDNFLAGIIIIAS